MGEGYAVVKTHSIYPSIEVFSFPDYEMANAYLQWYWEDLCNTEYGNGIELDERETFHEADYAKIQWREGDYVELVVEKICPISKDFPDDFRNYVC